MGPCSLTPLSGRDNWNINSSVVQSGYTLDYCFIQMENVFVFQSPHFSNERSTMTMLLRRRCDGMTDFDFSRQKRSEGDQEEWKQREGERKGEKSRGRAEERDD